MEYEEPTLVCRSTDPTWLSERSRCVTASDIPAIMGLSKYSSREDIFREKLGGPTRIVNKNMWWGSEMEPHNLRAFGKLTGLVVEHDNSFWRRGVVGATTDGTVLAIYSFPGDCWTDEYARFGQLVAGVYGPRRGVGLVEMKNIGQYGLKEWRGGPPEYYAWQCQAQMYCTGLDYCLLVAKIGSSDMVQSIVEADKTKQDSLLSAANDFWTEVCNEEARRGC